MKCIYQIRNIINNKIYIGHTINFRRRKNTHMRLLKADKHHSSYLQNAFNLGDEADFVFEILEEIDDKNRLAIVENEYIEKLNPDYNMMRNVFSHIGMKRSPETCAKISASLKGKKISEERKNHLREINLGKKYSPETCAKKSVSSGTRKTVYQYTKSMVLIKEWRGSDIAASELNIDAKCIRAVALGYKKTYKSFIWIYTQSKNENQNGKD